MKNLRAVSDSCLQVWSTSEKSSIESNTILRKGKHIIVKGPQAFVMVTNHFIVETQSRKRKLDVTVLFIEIAYSLRKLLEVIFGFFEIFLRSNHQ